MEEKAVFACRHEQGASHLVPVPLVVLGRA
jgi:hypothetical protein